ncbi:MAG: HD domain-containing protein [Sphaerochaetaceae bacterium]|nr:HD domain-containing protein [Sphaerochaetaceae bacterium]
MLSYPVSQKLSDFAKIFTKQGRKVYLVGGAVRDFLLGEPNDDYDFCTDARPEDVISMFRRTYPTGIKHGTVTVRFNGECYEVTTFRTDGSYIDHRHPQDVSFTEDIAQDLCRRDFTINAFAADLGTGAIIDLFNGCEDLRQGVVRCIGEPQKRFEEDALRLMRAIRFASKLGFIIEDETWKALCLKHSDLAFVAKERIREELMKIINGPRPEMGIRLMHESGLLSIVLPELEACESIAPCKHHSRPLLEHQLAALDFASSQNYCQAVRLAALLHDIGKPEAAVVRNDSETYYGHEIISESMTRALMNRLRFSNDEIDLTCHLVANHMFHYEASWTDAAVRRFVNKVGLDCLELLFQLRRCDRYAIDGSLDESDIIELGRRIREIQSPSLLIKDLAVNGRDMMGLGLKGQDIGRVLSALLEKVIESPELNEKKTLLDLARSLL